MNPPDRVYPDKYPDKKTGKDQGDEKKRRRNRCVLNG